MREPQFYSCHSEVSAKRAAEEPRWRVYRDALNDNDRLAADATATERGRIRSVVVAIDSENVAFGASRFFSDARRASLLQNDSSKSASQLQNDKSGAGRALLV